MDPGRSGGEANGGPLLSKAAGQCNVFAASNFRACHVLGNGKNLTALGVEGSICFFMWNLIFLYYQVKTKGLVQTLLQDQYSLIMMILLKKMQLRKIKGKSLNSS